MPILAIDTATLVSSVALATRQKLIAEITLQTRKTHSEMLMPHIAQLLSMAEVEKKDLQAVAVSIGPGSFTGLRIGLATAKALSLALSIPLVGVPTLAALAYGCTVPGVLLAPMLDAQKGNVYQALFRWEEGELRELQAARVVSFTAALEEFTAESQPVVLLGEAAMQHEAEIAAKSGNILLAPPHLVISRAASVALFGCLLLDKGITHDAVRLEPVYIRRSEAEELWEKKQKTCV